MTLQANRKWSQMVVGGDRRIAERFGIDPIAARLLLNRGLKEDEEIRRFLYGTTADLDDPRLMDQIDTAAGLLHDAVLRKKRIRIIGDYDADGIFSVYILYHALEKAGALVSYDIPDRITDGFGMSMRMIENAHRDGIDLIVTCDNGIAQNAEVSRAKQLGMKVIITDHHEPNFTVSGQGEKEYHLPDADAVVDPKKPGCPYPNKHLCGAGVAWKLMYLYESSCLSGRWNDSCRDIKAPHPDSLIPVTECPIAMETLPFAAAATITDIMMLTGENRILVKNGLKLLQETSNTGMRALIRECGLEGRRLNSGHIGFMIGPCMNASGRLDTASGAVGLLLEKNPEKAASRAHFLASLNLRRKEMTEEGKAAAFELIETTSLSKDRVLIVYLKDVHESVAGIIASKVKDTLHRPVIIFTDTENPECLKGSGRSIESYNMHDELSRVSDLFVKFGGHPMAAGVTIERTNLEKLRIRLNENCALTPDDLAQKVLLDAVPPFSYLSEDLIRQLELLEPYGAGMRQPLFGCSQVRILRLYVAGKTRSCVRMTADDGTARMTAVYFGDADEFISALRQKYGEEETARMLSGKENRIRLSLAYRPVINEYRSERNVQLQIAYFQ